MQTIVYWVMGQLKAGQTYGAENVDCIPACNENKKIQSIYKCNSYVPVEYNSFI